MVKSHSVTDGTLANLDERSVEHWLEHASHLLPSQGPIKVFVHHNTLHAFEDSNFGDGVLQGLQVYGCEPYFSEDRFRQEMKAGRIQVVDLEQVLQEELGDESDRLIAGFGTRFELQLAMMKHPLRSLPYRELEWIIAEGGGLQEYFADIDPQAVRRCVEATRKEILKQLESGLQNDGELSELLRPLVGSSTLDRVQNWSESKWRKVSLEFLWAVCNRGVQRTLVSRSTPSRSMPSRATDSLDQGTTDPEHSKQLDFEANRLVNDLLIRFSSCYLDQGFAAWPMPDREDGFFGAFCSLYQIPAPSSPAWLKSLPSELNQIQAQHKTTWEVVIDELHRLDIDQQDYEHHVTQSLLELRGWAGMIWQMETSSPWTPKPAPPGSLMGYLAVRLLLKRLATEYAKTMLPNPSAGQSTPSKDLYPNSEPTRTCASIAFTIFQMAQFRSWTPRALFGLSSTDWSMLLREIEKFSSLQRRRIFQLAYERRYRVQALDAVSIHSANQRLRRASQTKSGSAKFQVITCIDDREESFRRHLEEVEPACETYGAAGFFAVVMYYRGAAEAHFRPLCPINIVPKHYVCEEPVFSAELDSGRRSQRRKWIGRVSHQVHSGSRTILGGVVTGLFGTLATFPLVARVLAPHITARIRDSFGGFIRLTATELHLERTTERPGAEWDSLGYSTQEMAGIVVRILQDIGLVQDFSRLVLFLGHGSSSLNNPHESAYNCGACSGGRGGPNARAFASMANDPRVRELVAQSGILIPDETWFIGGYHNTCNDHIDYHDLDRLPWQARPLFREMQANIDEARARNAQERVRRFESARFGLSPADALRHVEERAEDLSQARPEYNHATNALCFVGRRQWSRGLFLDRRAFLASYDPSIDDAKGKIVERILQAAIPVCGGINLEYYFSTVDPEGYGCGSKLPHNIASLAGVMTGAASDLRPGLSAQMVEIHEPLRILFVIETTSDIMHRIIAENAAIRALVEGEWVQLALLDSETSQISLYHKGTFEPYRLQSNHLNSVQSSAELYRSERGHLPFASIDAVSSSISLGDAS